jgi:hypothetical protein
MAHRRPVEHTSSASLIIPNLLIQMTMAELQPDLSSRKRIFCNKCRNETNHTVLCDHAYENAEVDGEDLINWEKYVYRFWICAGCESATLEECWTTLGYEDRNGKQIYNSEYFPKRTERDIRKKYFRQLPQKLDKIYEETILAFNENLMILCAAGLRTLIEGICEDKGIKGRNLEERINALVTLLPQNIVASLHSFRFMGNEALHELTPPKAADLRLAIEISEDLLNFLYELDYKASQLPAKQRNAP